MQLPENNEIVSSHSKAHFMSIKIQLKMKRQNLN